MGKSYVLHAAVAALMLCAHVAAACSCRGVPSVEEARASAAFVIVGRVVLAEAPAPRPASETDTTMVESTGDMIRYAIVPLESWKGPVADTLIIYSARSSSSCGFGMSSNREYLLYVSSYPEALGGREWAGGKPKGPTLTVGSCDRNKRRADAASDIRALGPATWRRTGK